MVRAVGEGERILLTVADGGRGIPAADRGRAVERFVRLEQSRSHPGSGLGLSLASAVARLHGGELKLEDNHPGLKTVISLPRAGAVRRARRRAPFAPKGATMSPPRHGWTRVPASLSFVTTDRLVVAKRTEPTAQVRRIELD